MYRLNNLYIRYNGNDVLESLLYADVKKNYTVYLNESEPHSYLVWDVFFNNQFATNDNHIVTRHITMFNIERLKTISKEVISTLTYDTAKHKKEDTFIAHLGEFNGKSIDIELDKNMVVLLITTDDYTIARVQNTTTGEYDEVHYLDKDMVFLNNKKESYELMITEDKTVKFEFDRRDDITISNYLLYHKPFRVTDYTESKQYLIKYDKKGLVMNMIDTSRPSKNLCKYDPNVAVVGKLTETVSVHPNLYNPFNVKASMVGTSRECLHDINHEDYTYRFENTTDRKEAVD